MHVIVHVLTVCHFEHNSWHGGSSQSLDEGDLSSDHLPQDNTKTVNVTTGCVVSGCTRKRKRSHTFDTRTNAPFTDKQTIVYSRSGDPLKLHVDVKYYIVHMYSMPYYTYGSTANFLFLGPTALIYISKERRCNKDLRDVGFCF